VLFNSDVLFIHVPKAAGMAVTQYLIDNLPGPTTLSVPAGHAPPDPRLQVVEGTRHENLPEAVERLRTLNRSLDSFRLVLAVIRNPYALEVSRFHYYRLGRPWDRGLLYDLAATGDFDRFCREALYPYIRAPKPIETFYTIDGAMPSNMRLLRAEQLADDLASALGPPKIPLERVNESRHQHWSEYITTQNEPYIFEKFRWLFQFYPRMTEFQPATSQAR
jgi:hypothetical protein